jgi:hypothetical protein
MSPDVDLQPGLPLVIPFGVTHQAYSQLEAHFGLSERGMGLGEVASLVGTSYVIGMSIALCNDW